MSLPLTIKHFLLLEAIIKRVEHSGKAYVLANALDREIRIGKILTKEKIQIEDVYYLPETNTMFIIFANAKREITFGYFQDEELGLKCDRPEHLMKRLFMFEKVEQLRDRSKCKFKKDNVTVVPLTFNPRFKEFLLGVFNNPKDNSNKDFFEFAYRQEPFTRLRLLMLTEKSKLSESKIKNNQTFTVQ